MFEFPKLKKPDLARKTYRKELVRNLYVRMYDAFQTGKSDFIQRNGSKILWLDLGDLGDLVNPRSAQEQWQNHGLGLLRTIMHQNRLVTDMFSTRQCMTW